MVMKMLSLHVFSWRKKNSTQIQIQHETMQRPIWVTTPSLPRFLLQLRHQREDRTPDYEKTRTVRKSFTPDSELFRKKLLIQRLERRSSILKAKDEDDPKDVPASHPYLSLCTAVSANISRYINQFWYRKNTVPAA
ncbi:unnamed protein product [Amoebophrya sp. A120]|nr:unnamed protein product [Amoebophrya sp. A120]|eukprot:GSA120T00025349001.1